MIRLKLARLLMWYASKVFDLGAAIGDSGLRSMKRRMTRHMTRAATEAVAAAMGAMMESGSQGPTEDPTEDPTESDRLFWPPTNN